VRNGVFVFWTAVGTALILTLIRLYGFLENTMFYFSFRQIATRPLRDASIVGLLITLGIPLATGLILTYLGRQSLVGPATGAGFQAALLQSWPVLFFPSLRPYLVPDSLVDQPVKLFVIHGLYVASYSMLSRLGAWLGVFTLSTTLPPSPASERDSAVRNIVLALAASALWQILLSLWS